MDAAALADIGERLDAFVEQVFSSLKRKDQRATAGIYTRGLMLDGRRKSMQPMADRLGVDHQRLQQFVTTSPWDPVPVRKTLSRKACDLISPDAWVIDDTGFAKDGNASPCVARQYSGTLGKVGNCQVAVSVHAATDTASAPLDWRLYLPESWDDQRCDDPETASAIIARRRRNAIPDEERYRTKAVMALEMLDELISWGRTPPVIVADAGYGDSATFRQGLTDRDLTYVVAVKGATLAHPGDAVPATAPYSGRGRPPTRRYPAVVTCKDLVLAAGVEALTEIPWRRGTKTGPANPAAAMRSRFVALRIRPANRTIPRDEGGVLPQAWLLAEWPAGAAAPTDFWLATLPEDTPLSELVRLAKIRWRIEHDYRELKTGLGLDHFEGRSWLGWHHHVTLVTAAHLFLTSLRLTDPKAVGRD
ncbi:IS701 family transposase [Rhodococcus rhodochrous]|uniref:IS701 family transposase n=1 Tax=Rhodococcus rhodochrous TaxID=1829 RepID=UPI00036F413D|nr:IS701 family transposase [Rhodococcus rhodochrous]